MIENNLKSNQFSQELGTNSIADQYLTLEKQLDKSNLLSHEPSSISI
jgi:hypothetical protein